MQQTLFYGKYTKFCNWEFDTHEWVDCLNCKKLKRSSVIHGSFSRDGIVRIKRREKDKPVKIFHMDKIHGFFPEIYFGDADDENDIFLDASQVVNDSVQSSY